MNLAEKIVFLRKKNSLSQEELAEKLDVTRQSVSKWESGQSVPDLNKIIQIGELFGISLDLLLKDDTGEWDIFFSSGSSFSQSGNTAENDFPDEENKKIKRLDLKSTDDFLVKSKKNARLYAIATFLFIISPMLLMTLCARDYGSESKQVFAVVIGIVSLLSIVALGVGTLIYTSFKNQEFSFVYKNLFSLDGSAKVSVSEKKREFEPLFYKRIIIERMRL